MTNERLEKIVAQVQHNNPEATHEQIVEVVDLCEWSNDLSYLAIADLVLDYLSDPLTDEDNEPVTIEGDGQDETIIAAAVELITDGHCNSDTIGAEDALQSYLYGSAHEGYEAECEYVESLDPIGYARLVQTIRQTAARQIEQMDRDFEADHA